MRYAEVLEELEAAFDFCESLKLGERVKKSRFHEYREFIKKLCAIIGPGPFDELPSNVKKELEEQQLNYLFSLFESLEFIHAIDYVKSCDVGIVREKLVRILNGPLLPKDEDANTNDARNTLFEVNLAYTLHAAGLRPSLGALADIEIKIAGKQLLIECKRPFRENGISAGMKRAKKQIETRVRGMPSGSRGVIAISATKILNPGDKLLPYVEVPAAQQTLSTMLSELAQKNQKALSNLGRKVIGVLFHVITLSLDTKHDKYSLGEQFNAHHLAKLGSPDYSAFQALGDALDKIATK